jgi:ABC-type branched-subunit amino acid transport system ATPase component
MIRAITGLLPLHNGQVTSGTISMEGQPVLGLPSHKLVRMGMGGFMGTMAMAVVVPMTVFVPVVPQLGFVEQKEKNQTHQQSQKQLVRAHAALKSFWQ